MKYPLIASAASLALAVAAETPTPSQLATYGLTLPQFERIKASESPYDFDHATLQEDLWIDAAAFAYETSSSHATDAGPTSLSYMPYIVCNVMPDLSGRERIQMIDDIFDNTTSVETSDYYDIDAAAANGVDGTCLLMRAYNDTVAMVYGQHPGAEDWLKISPLHQSMKMNNSTVDIVRRRFDDIQSGDYILPTTSSWFRYVNVLGSQSLLCPGVQNFGGAEVTVTDEEISEAVKDFIAEEDGKSVKEASFFHRRVNVDGVVADDASTATTTTTDPTTDRMEMWADVINKVDDMTLPNGTNYCRQNVIANNFLFVVDSDTLNVYARFSTDELLILADANDLMLDDLEICVLYMIMGLALNPMICWVEPKNQVRVVCPDGSSDLNSCPEPEGSGGGSSSFSIYGYGRLGGSAVSILTMAFSLWSYIQY